MANVYFVDMMSCLSDNTWKHHASLSQLSLLLTRVSYIYNNNWKHTVLCWWYEYFSFISNFPVALICWYWIYIVWWETFFQHWSMYFIFVCNLIVPFFFMLPSHLTQSGVVVFFAHLYEVPHILCSFYLKYLIDILYPLNDQTTDISIQKNLHDFRS